MLRILDKPAGITTHTSLSAPERERVDIDPVDSFLGHLSYRSGRSLWPVHRLDIGTTGVLLAADTAEDAASLSEAFEARTVKKTYEFLTDRAVPQTISENGGVFHIESHIDRGSGGRGTNFFSNPPTLDHPANAITDFELVRSEGEFSLWRARPLTGRPHQIRLHAEALGIPILGDLEHGGSSFPAVCLHAAHVRFHWNGQTIEASSPSPRWFHDLSVLETRHGQRIANWMLSVERRERLARSLREFELMESETMRLIHTEGGELRVDRLGSVYHLHWYDDALNEDDLEAVKNFIDRMTWKDWYLQTRTNRGKNPNETEIVTSRSDLPLRWSAREDDVRYGFRRDTGLSAGLFLDQRANRRWVRANSTNRRVLNLFAYTSGFSVAAALGKATKVVSVDLSKNFLEWSKANFSENGLDPLDPRFEFRAMEAREYLKWAKKKALQFEIVVCDPPSFGRSDKGVFRLEKDFDSLLEACVDVTAPGGRILFSTNYELFDNDEFHDRIGHFTRSKARQIRVLRTPSPDLDFEFPREARAMKSLFLEVL